MKLTIREVARTAGVSVATASMALNHRDGVSEKTREKVERVARELNYIPDFSARSLVMQDSKCIGLMIPEIQNPFYSAIVDIMSRIAEKKGYTLLLGISGNKPVQEERNLKMFLSRRVLGIVIVPMLMDKPDVSYLRLVRGTNVPLVFCTERYADTDEPAVMCDFEKGEYDITNFLLNKGLRDLCFVTVDVDTQFANLRMKGFVRALEEAGIAPREGRILRLKEARYDDAYE
ncbi:MAG: LacI family DNA-binding transcriptional regulator, partial [Clostridia bacterium]